MTEFESKVLSELAEMKMMFGSLQSDYSTLLNTVKSLRAEFSISQITYFENLSPAAVVSADYVAYRFGCSKAAVVRGRFETDKIPRHRAKPLAFIKREVDSIWQNLNQPVSEKAAKYRHSLKKV